MKKTISVFTIASLLFVVLCGAGTAQAVQPRNWVVCPRCSAPVTQNTYLDINPVDMITCPNGYGQDTIYHQIRITDFTCAAGCGFEHQDRVSASYFAPCEHVDPISSASLYDNKDGAQITEEIQAVISESSNRTLSDTPTLSDEKKAELLEQIAQSEKMLAD